MNNSIANYNVVSGCKIYISTFYKIIYNFLYDKSSSRNDHNPKYLLTMDNTPYTSHN